MVKERHFREAGRAGVAPAIPRVAFENPVLPQLEIQAFPLSALVRRRLDPDLSQPHRPDFHLLMLGESGRGTHSVDFVRHACMAGTLVQVRPGQVHQFGKEPGFEAKVVIFRQSFLPLEWERLEEAPGSGAAGAVPHHLLLGWPNALTVPAARRASVTALFDMLLRECAAEGASQRVALLRHLLWALLLLLSDFAAGPSADTANVQARALIERFRRVVEASFTEHRDVSRYAEVLRCSPRTLGRACEAVLGMSAKQFVDERVALEAKRLLVNSPLPVARLGERLGFSEATNFVKFFRRQVGKPPAAFRREFLAEHR